MAGNGIPVRRTDELNMTWHDEIRGYLSLTGCACERVCVFVLDRERKREVEVRWFCFGGILWVVVIEKL